MADYVAVSKKIYSFKERRRLRALAKSLLPPGFGLIVRTVAEDKSAKTLDTDLRLLLDRWRKIEGKLKEKADPPVLLHEDVSLVSSVIRDLFSDEYDKIRIDDHRLYRNIRSYVSAVAPHMAPRVDLHKGKVPIFEDAKIAHSVAEAFAPRVDLPSGGYLFIEHTEAMHVIDVNSGRAGKGLTQEENSLKVNLESARAIAKQLRLRDLGGIIVVDFIDLREDKNRKKVYDELKREFRKDRAVTKILPMSDFGVVQITRQRLRPSITTQQEAPGAGDQDTDASRNGEPRAPRERQAPSPEQLTQKIERWLGNYRKRGGKGPVSLNVHPYTAAFLTKRFPSFATRWCVRYRVRVRIESDSGVRPGEFKAVADRPARTSGKDKAGPRKSSSDRGSVPDQRSTRRDSDGRRDSGKRPSGTTNHETQQVENTTVAGESRPDRTGT
jgi:ribonuclease G